MGGSFVAMAPGYDYRVTPSGAGYVVTAILAPPPRSAIPRTNSPRTIEVTASLDEAKAAAERHCAKHTAEPIGDE